MPVCGWCFSSAALWRSPEGALQVLEEAATVPDGSIGACAICGMPSIWRMGGPRRMTAAEAAALRPELARALVAALDASRLRNA